MIGKKRVLNFECPNCNAKNQNRFLATYDSDKPKIWCTNCESKFSSTVIERIYYMGLSRGKCSDQIRVICVGDDYNPATTQDITNIMRHVEKHKQIPTSSELLVREFSVNRSPKPGVLVVRIGSDDRPASRCDFEDIRDQLDKVLGDPELTIITHHNFELEWVPTQSDPKVPFILASHVESQLT